MGEITILQKGNIYFFCRPKIGLSEVYAPEDIQRLFMIVKPDDSHHYTVFVIGHKKLPQNSPYFCFVDYTAENMHELVDILKEQHYSTSTRGERTVSSARCLGQGKYLLVKHEEHTHLCYQLSIPSKINDIQKRFNLKKYADYLISVKNPNKSDAYGVGLSSNQKANYPPELQNLFGDYRFIPLHTPDFINYKGTELLLIGKGKTDIEERYPELKRCLKMIPTDNLLNHFKEMEAPVMLLDFK